MKKKVLLVAAKTGYQVREFYGAAERLGVDLVLATDRCHVLENPWGDDASAVQFDQPAAGLEALEVRGPFDGIVAVGDQPARVAAEAAGRLKLPFHPLHGTRAAGDKYLARELFRKAGLNVPGYSLLQPGEAVEALPCPCVLKPLHLSASRGVIRANGPEEFAQAYARIRKMIGEEAILVEDFIPGREFALEGILTCGRLTTLALFDKPDPLDGPFFEETIYITPSREAPAIQRAIENAVQRAAKALGLSHGPVHAEMRLNAHGVWVLEVAARPIGGLCSRVLRFDSPSGAGLEEVLLRHALGEDISSATLASGAHGVMMIPIPSAGIYSGVEGVEQASRTDYIESVEITAKEGQYLEPLPEGTSYLGFLFARAGSCEQVESALRQAHACLRFCISRALPVVR